MKFSIHKLLVCISKRIKHLENPRKESIYILKNYLNLQEKDFILNSVIYLNKKQLKELIQIINRRKEGVPFAYIFRKKEFFSIPFFINEFVLIPRPETEILVEYVLKEIQRLNKKYFCLDIGTGSGCIPISIIKNSHQIQKFIAIDVSKEALKVARKNKILNLNIEQQKILKFIKLDFIKSGEKLNFINFDIIVSNPPYILKEELIQLEKEIFYEPIIALLVEEPYIFYKKFFENCMILLKKGGMLFLESSPRLIPLQIEILNKMNISDMEIFQDYQNLERFLVIKK